MKDLKVKCIAIVETGNIGTVTLQQQTKDGTPGVRVQMQFPNSADAAGYEYGKEYTVNVVKSK